MTNNYLAELPAELKTEGMKVDLAVGVCFINNECYLHTVDRRIKFKGFSVLVTREKSKVTTNNYYSRIWIIYFGFRIRVVYE